MQIKKVLERVQRLFDEALPKFNWGASALDANAIKLLNEVPGEVTDALSVLQTLPPKDDFDGWYDTVVKYVEPKDVYHWMRTAWDAAGSVPDAEVRHITDPADLIAGRAYWLRDKVRPHAEVAVLHSEQGFPFFKNRFWVYPGNNQAMERWDIFGPVPEHKMPDFDALKKGE